MRSGFVLNWLVMLAPALGQESPVYYDYVENGVLTGGRVMVDRANPEHRRVFGLDPEAGAAALVHPFTTIRNSGPTSNRVDIVLLGDGYTAAELGAYATHAGNVNTSFFAQEPFAAYATYFNVHRVDVTSAESGVDEIDNGIFRNTALDMAYGCFGIDRLLCISVFKAQQAAGSAPQWEQILALANSTRYGGAGYPGDEIGTLAGINASAVEIALHEFGHAFADLADEYDYGDGATYTGPEPFETNVSIYTAPQQVAMQTKWHLWVDLPGVESFQGAYYNQFGIYRPTFNSKMRSLGATFQQVNVEQLVLSMYEIVSPIDDATPASATALSQLETLFVTPLAPTDHALAVQWAVDGVDVAGATGPTFRLADHAPAPGIYDVSVTVRDTTTRVRDEAARDALMTATRQWQVEVPDCQAVEPVQGDPNPIGKNRFLSFMFIGPADRGAVRVKLESLHHPDPPYAGGPAADFSSFEGQHRWVGPPTQYFESSTSEQSFYAASLQCMPHYMDWSTVGLVHVTGPEIVPSSSYQIQALVDGCDAGVESNFSAPILAVTARWADVAGPFNPPDASVQPDISDVSALVDKFRNTPAALTKVRGLLAGAPGNIFGAITPDVLSVDFGFSHISSCVDAFRGVPYPYTIQACP